MSIHFISGKTLIEGIEKAVIDMIYVMAPSLLNMLVSLTRFPIIILFIKNGKTSALTFYNPETERIEKIEKHSCYRNHSAEC